MLVKLCWRIPKFEYWGHYLLDFLSSTAKDFPLPVWISIRYHCKIKRRTLEIFTNLSSRVYQLTFRNINDENIIICNLQEFFTTDLTGDLFFYWSLSDRKSPQVSRFLLRIAVLNSAVDWIVSIQPLIHNSLSLFFRHLRTVFKGTNNNWYDRYFYVAKLFSSPAISKLFVYLFVYFHFRWIVWERDIYNYKPSTNY